MKHTVTRISVVLVFLALLGGCGSSSPASPNDGLRVPQVDMAEVMSLVLRLREWEIELEFQEQVENPIFAAPADLYRWGGEDVRLYGFSTVEDAEGAIGSLSEDGRTVAGEPIPWSEPVHYYRDERLVVLHVGSGGRLGLAFDDILGGQVAGD